MIHSLSGYISKKLAQNLLLENAGIEWQIEMPDTDIASLPAVGEKVRIFTHLHHKEDSMRLFGFASFESRETFFDLLKVNGIGPKAAIKILSNIHYEQLIEALDTENMAVLEKISGVGKVTAQKMVLALKGKIRFISEKETEAREEWADLVQALADMGYDKKDARLVLKKAALRLDSSLTQSQKEEALLKAAILELN